MANTTIYPYGTNGQLPSSIGVINDLTTGGADKALSAEMGKVLKVAVQTLIDSMGEYCFPNGRPTLSFETPKWNVTQNLTNVDSDFSALRIDKGGELTIHLTAQYGYVLGSVTVKMGNVDITSTAYDSTTGVVHIAQVTGDVVVTAAALSYNTNGLVFHLDGIDKGNNSGSWTDLVGGVVFTNHGATSVASGWDFGGTAYMESSNALSGMSIFDGTLEVCFTSRLTGQSYFVFVAGGSNLEMVFAPNAGMNGLYGSSYGYFDGYIFTQSSEQGQQLAIQASSPNTDNGIGAKIVSLAGNATTGILNGLSKSLGTTFFSADSVTRIGNRQKNGVNEKFFTGIIHSIRYYDRYLSNAEILQNQKLDNARFNLGLTIE